MGKIYCILGKSASGKGTIANKLLLRKPGLKKYVMYTTRPQRKGEVEGINYHFTTIRVLKDLERKGRLIESRIYHTVEGLWYYATVDDGQMNVKNKDILTEGTLESFVKLRDYFGRERIVPFYIEVEDGERLLRALRRERLEIHPAYMEMCRRFLADCEDFSEEKLRESGIIKRYENMDLDKCVEEILGEMK